VVTRVAGNDALGSALMGITVPTYRRWTSSWRVDTAAQP